MHRLFAHTDPNGESVQLLALPGHTHALVVHASNGEGENADVNLPRAKAVELHAALARWLDGR